MVSRKTRLIISVVEIVSDGFSYLSWGGGKERSFLVRLKIRVKLKGRKNRDARNTVVNLDGLKKLR